MILYKENQFSLVLEKELQTTAPYATIKVASLQVMARDLPLLQLISRLQKSVHQEKMAPLEGGLYDIIAP